MGCAVFLFSRDSSLMKKVFSSNKNSSVDGFDASEVASHTYLSVQEVTALLEAFKAKGNSKAQPISLKAFLKVVEEVNNEYHNPLFNVDEAEITFHLLDANHDGKSIFVGNPSALPTLIPCYWCFWHSTVDPFELIYGVSVLCEGNEVEKAELVFKAVDLNSNGLISKDELSNFLGECETVLTFLNGVNVGLLSVQNSTPLL